MTTYVPGTDDSDHKKQNMSLQQIGPKLDTAITNVATNTTDIATNAAAITALQSGTVTTIAGNSGAFTLNATSGITNATNDIKLSQATSAQFGAVKVDNTTIKATAGVISATIATQADQETSTSLVAAVTPGRQQSHPSASKAWVNFAGSGTNGAQTINASYNVSGVSRTAAGTYTVSFSTVFSSANYAAVTSGILSGTVITTQPTTPAAGSIVVFFANSSTQAAVDPAAGMLVAFGDQ